MSNFYSIKTKIFFLELTEIKKPKGQAEAENTDYSPDGVNKLHQKHEKIKSFFEKNQEKHPLYVDFFCFEKCERRSYKLVEV